MIKTAYIDCFAGLSGDMFLGALIDLGLEGKELFKELKQLGLSGYRIDLRKESRHELTGTRVRITQNSRHEHRSLADIENIVTLSNLPGEVIESSMNMFRDLVSVEARIHGTTEQEVVLHEVGAVDAPTEQRRALRRYGMRLGMAFQITDDVLDYTESQQVTGKPTGLDLKEHKITLPLIAALDRMTPAERAKVEALMADPEPGDRDVAEVIGIVQAKGGVDAARSRAHEYAEQAVAELEVLPAGTARDALADGITYAVERRS